MYSWSNCLAYKISPGVPRGGSVVIDGFTVGGSLGSSPEDSPSEDSSPEDPSPELSTDSVLSGCCIEKE